MKMILACLIALGSTAAMASLHAAGISITAADAVLTLGIVGGLMGAPFVMDHPNSPSTSAQRRAKS